MPHLMLHHFALLCLIDSKFSGNLIDNFPVNIRTLVKASASIEQHTSDKEYRMACTVCRKGQAWMVATCGDLYCPFCVNHWLKYRMHEARREQGSDMLPVEVSGECDQCHKQITFEQMTPLMGLSTRRLKVFYP